MRDIILEVKNVSKQFYFQGETQGTLKEAVARFFFGKKPKIDSFHALHNVSFTVGKGESFGIIGENGAGKSTLLKILSGIVQPDKGEINFYGKPVSILDVGAGFHPELTGSENIFFAASLYGFTRKEIADKYNEIVKFSGIGNFIHEPVKHYSSGMYLRLAFSIVAFLNADIYLIDEIINVGDANFQSKCKAKMEELITSGKTLLVASHNMSELALLCNMILLLEKGQIKGTGGWDIVQQYVSNVLPQFKNLTTDSPYFMVNTKGKTSQNKEIMILNSGIANYQICENGIDIGHPLMVFIEFELTKSLAIDVTLRFYNSVNLLVFVCTTFQKDVARIDQAGMFRVEFEIPSKLLNSGFYSLDLIIMNNIQSALLKGNGKVGDEAMLYYSPKFLNLKMGEEIAPDKFSAKYGGVVKPYIRTLVTSF